MANSCSSTPLVDAVETEMMLRSSDVGNGNGGNGGVGPTEIPVISEEDEKAEAAKDKVLNTGPGNNACT